MKKARHTAVIRLRRLLLIGFVAFAVGLTGLYLLGRVQRTPELREVGDDGAAPGEGPITVGEGFSFELSDQGRRVFGIRAARIISRQQDSFSLEGVELRVQREGGGEYQVASASAQYNARTNNATLAGDVVLEGPNGVVLRSQGLEMRRRGRYLVSTSPVSFEFGAGYAGKARQLEANFRSDEFLLAGEVQVRSLPGVGPPLALDCRRVSYDRDARRLQAEGDVVLVRGEDRVAARRLTLELAADERTMQRIDGLWDVAVEVVRPGADGLVHRLGAEGHELVVSFAEDRSPVAAELASGPHPTARLTAEAGGLARVLEGGDITARFAGGQLTGLGAVAGVRLEETLAVPEAPALRLLCGDELDMTLTPGGEITGLAVTGGVDLTEPWSQARTPRLALDEARDRLVLEGPGTWLARDGVRLAAPRILYDRATGEVEALDGVRAEMARRDGFALGPGADPEEPVQVVAERATWSAAAGFHFEQSVRAWQGSNYLLAQTLGGDDDRLTASGPVKTVWATATTPGGEQGEGEREGEGEGAGGEAGEEDAEAAAAGGGDEAPAAARQEPLEVTAQELVYERAARRLVYQGAARATQGQRTLRCSEIRALLDAEDELERMECDGPVQIDDPVSGNKVYGDAALYLPDSETVRVTGDPVRLVDSQGGQFEGKAMRYDLRTGKAELDSQTPEDAVPAEPDADGGGASDDGAVAPDAEAGGEEDPP